MDRERIKRRREAVKPGDEKKRMRRGEKKRRKACKFGRGPGGYNGNRIS